MHFANVSAQAPSTMSRQTASSRPSISSGMSIPVAEPISFEKYLQLAQEVPSSPEKIEQPKEQKKGKQTSRKYGIHVQRNKNAKDKGTSNFIELNRQNFEKKNPSAQAPEHSEEPERNSNMSWRNLIKGVLDSQRGKIPLLLAVEAGNQSMCRELLSTQTTEQLQVSGKLERACMFSHCITFGILLGNYGKWRHSVAFGCEAS